MNQSPRTTSDGSGSISPLKRGDSYKMKTHVAILPSQFIREKRRRSRSLDKINEELGNTSQSFHGNDVDSPKQSIFKQKTISSPHGKNMIKLPLENANDNGDEDDDESTPKSTHHMDVGIPIHVKEALKSSFKSTPR